MVSDVGSTFRHAEQIDNRHNYNCRLYLVQKKLLPLDGPAGFKDLEVREYCSWGLSEVKFALLGDSSLCMPRSFKFLRW